MSALLRARAMEASFAIASQCGDNGPVTQDPSSCRAKLLTHGHKPATEPDHAADREAAALRHPREPAAGGPVPQAPRPRMAAPALVPDPGGARCGPRGHEPAARILARRRQARAGFQEDREARREPRAVVDRQPPP